MLLLRQRASSGECAAAYSHSVSVSEESDESPRAKSKRKSTRTVPLPTSNRPSAFSNTRSRRRRRRKQRKAREARRRRRQQPLSVDFDYKQAGEQGQPADAMYLMSDGKEDDEAAGDCDGNGNGDDQEVQAGCTSVKSARRGVPEPSDACASADRMQTQARARPGERAGWRYREQ